MQRPSHPQQGTQTHPHVSLLHDTWTLQRYFGARVAALQEIRRRPLLRQFQFRSASSRQHSATQNGMQQRHAHFSRIAFTKCPRRRSTPSLIPISTPSIAQLQLHNNTRTGRAGPVSLAASRRICSLVFKGVKGSRAFTCSDTRWPLSSPRHGQISSRPYARAPGPTIH